MIHKYIVFGYAPEVGRHISAYSETGSGEGLMAGKKEKAKTVKKRESKAESKTKKTQRAGKSSPPDLKKTSAVRKTKARALYIAGIGASAGGLEAFEQFFRNMPENSGIAFVLVPHLAPTHKSIIDELLRKYTGMEVRQAEDGIKVKPDCIYIIQPDKDMAILHGILQLIEPAERRGLRHPIDFFLRSLAQDQGEQAIAIILSGTGTEGALGSREIKGEGGLVIVQDPASAKYDGMPRSAIATGIADYVLLPEKMPELLMKYVKRTYPQKTQETGMPESKVTDALQKIFIMIRQRTGHDFTSYKKNTIMRRIERRMGLHQIEHISDYVTLLRDSNDEVDTLFKELLIRVTHFFRDPAVFEFMKKKVLPQLFDNRSYEHPVRVWVPACSTGEEAYSLAILMHEYLSGLKQDFRVQIFATDLDGEAIDAARSGLFPEGISADVSKERLNRYFEKEDGSYRISKKLREMVVFASHNIIKDPPFSKIDLLSCRNLLIYLGQDLQKKLMPLFHYSLRQNGFLLLGTSETIGQFADLFSVYGSKFKLYRPKSVRYKTMPDLEISPAPAVNLPAPVQRDRELEPDLNFGEMTKKMLLDDFAPACVVINESGDILYFHGRTGKYLEPSPGKARLNIYEMAREGLKSDLKNMVRKAITQKNDAVFDGLKVRTNGETQSVRLRVKHFRGSKSMRDLTLVVFEEPSSPTSKKTVLQKMRKTEESSRVAELAFELKSTREQLQTTIEELEASNEELQSTNEELQSANEELQSTNEEIETSKEELQSVNEELLTLNSESQNRIEELTQLNNDLKNLMAGTDIATLFLDNDLNIMRFTPAIKKIANILPADLGRPVSDIKFSLASEMLTETAEEVLRTLIPVEHEVQGKAGEWFIMKCLPYRTLDNVIGGAVITFADITEQKKLQAELEDSLQYADGIIETIREPLLVLDSAMKVVSANKAFFDTFKVLQKETEGVLIYDLGNKQWDTPELKKLLEDILPGNNALNGYVIERSFPLIGHRKMLLNARRVLQKGKKTEMILLVFEDITGKNKIP